MCFAPGRGAGATASFSVANRSGALNAYQPFLGFMLTCLRGVSLSVSVRRAPGQPDPSLVGGWRGERRPRAVVGHGSLLAACAAAGYLRASSFRLSGEAHPACSRGGLRSKPPLWERARVKECRRRAWEAVMMGGRIAFTTRACMLQHIHTRAARAANKETTHARATGIRWAARPWTAERRWLRHQRVYARCRRSCLARRAPPPRQSLVRATADLPAGSPTALTVRQRRARNNALAACSVSTRSPRPSQRRDRDMDDALEPASAPGRLRVPSGRLSTQLAASRQPPRPWAHLDRGRNTQKSV